MSGTFERQTYDVEAYNMALRQSTAPINRIMDPISVVRCEPCRVAEPGWIGKVGVSITHQRPIVDVESDLLRLNYKNTKDPNQQYKPTCPQCGKCMEGYPCGGGVVKGCQSCQEKLFDLPTCNVGTDYSRISNPICTAREVGINRFQPLCLDPQDESRWNHPSRIGISYRNVVKDNHVPCIPRPIDQSPALPRGGPVKTCSKVDNTCGVFLGAMHPHGAINRNWNQ